MLNDSCYSTDPLIPPNAKYKIYEKIGSGAYGEVYKGIRDDDNLSVALKRVMITDEEGNNNIPLSTHRELNVLRRLNKLGNENIVRLFDIVLNKIGDRMCIDLVFELSEYDLESYLKKFNLGGDMPLAKVLSLGQQLMDGVHFMHLNRVVHRDLKPANLLVDRYGSDLKITDFGLARILGFDSALTPIAVTLWYRSPEILFRSSYLTACDVWSVGCIIGEMVYGRPLFAAEGEVKQLEKIVCRLGHEAVDNWPDDSYVDSSSFMAAIDPTRSLDRVLKRADVGLRGLIKELLRFDPDQRMLSTDALAKLNELRKISSISASNNCSSCLNTPIAGQMCDVLDCAIESQNQMIVNSVVRNVLDEDFNEQCDRMNDVLIPGVADCLSIQDYPHEEIEVNGSRSIVSRSSSRFSVHPLDEDIVEESHISPVPKESDEVGDSFGSYRSQNDESYSSYTHSSQTGADSTDDDLYEVKELHELHRFNDGFIISDDSDTCKTGESCSLNISESSKDETRETIVIDITSDDSNSDHDDRPIVIVSDGGSRACVDDVENKSPHSVTADNNISPFLIPSKASCDNQDHQTSKLKIQKSQPLKEINLTDSEVSASPSRRDNATRKRIMSSDNSEDSASEFENSAQCVRKPTLVRHKSLRRRLSMVGPHIATDRRPLHRCSSVLVPVIGENEEMQNTSFGESSLSRALDLVSEVSSPQKLSDRPKVIVRRRSQLR